jgi:SagB-type dehydrogenase family enzyme
VALGRPAISDALPHQRQRRAPKRPPDLRGTGGSPRRRWSSGRSSKNRPPVRGRAPAIVVAPDKRDALEEHVLAGLHAAPDERDGSPLVALALRRENAKALGVVASTCRSSGGTVLFRDFSGEHDSRLPIDCPPRTLLCRCRGSGGGRGWPPSASPSRHDEHARHCRRRPVTSASTALRYHRATRVDATGSDEMAMADRGPRPPSAKAYHAPLAQPAAASALGQLLEDATGITGVRTVPGAGTFYFRRYSSAGALDPLEVYLVSGDDLYAFDPMAHALVPLAAVTRDELAGAAATRALADAGAVVVVTALLARTSWKYGERGYRHVWWDAGTMLANLLALAAARGFRPRLYVGFVDAQLDRLLGIDGTSEFTAAVVSLDVPPLGPAGIRPVRAPTHAPAHSYPLAEELHAASSLADAGAVERWRAGSGDDEPVLAVAVLEQALVRRRSIRRYGDAPLDAAALHDLLAWSEGPIPSDAPPVVRQRVAVAAAGVEPGIYDAELRRLAPRAADELRDAVGFAAMEQDHPRDAAVTVCQAADLGAVLESLGDRGYRWANLEAGIRAGRLQLGAAARGWGAAAATFYDDELARVMETTDAPLLLVSLGSHRAR